LPVRLASAPGGGTARVNASPWVLPGLREKCEPGSLDYHTPGGIGPGLVLQHGILSSSCTWGLLDPVLNDEFNFGAKVMISTPSTEPYDVQRDSLLRVMRRVGGQAFVMIGHSNGGIVSRRAAQVLAEEQWGKVRGVITINSPHLGAPAVRVPLVLLNATNFVFTMPYRALCVGPQRGCGEVEMLNDKNALLHQAGVLQFRSIFGEMKPNSYFNMSLNHNPVENEFIRVGITSHAPQRFVFARMFGDARCYPGYDCAGAGTQRRTERYYKHLVKSATWSTILGIGQLVSANPMASYSFATAIRDGTFAAVLRALDWIYRRVVSPGDDSDGIVPGKSQEYPNRNWQYHIYNAESHVGSTASIEVLKRLRMALSTWMSVPT
jgi:pimeloyl-ACP methyl ester carboxylesterase